MSKSTSTNRPSALDVPEEVMAWADAQTSHSQFESASIVMDQLWFRPDEDGFHSLTCSLTDQAFRVPSLSAVLQIHVRGRYPGEAVHDLDSYEIHPALAIKGEDAIRDAIRARMERQARSAAVSLHEVRQLAHLLSADLPVAWPAYWEVEEEAKLRGVK